MPKRGRSAEVYIACNANVSTGWLGADCVVLDAVNDQAHAISGHAAEVWAAIEAGRPLDAHHPATQAAVRRFAELGLVASPATSSVPVRRLSRRGALKAGAITGLSAVTITSIALPSAAMADSFATTDPYAWVYPSTGSFVIPAGGTVHLTMVGGGGGASHNQPGIAAAPLYVTLMNPAGNGNQTVDVLPGGGGFGGAGNTGGAGGSATLGGFGGGAGGTETDTTTTSGGGGGGGAATVISTTGLTIIAGAGGGAGSGYDNVGSATPAGGASGTKGEDGPELTDTPVTYGGGGGGYPSGGAAVNTNSYSGDSAANPTPPANLVVSATANGSAAFAGFNGLGAQGAQGNGSGGGGGVLVVGDITSETGGASVSDTPA